MWSAAERSHVDRPVGRELRRVDEDPGAGGVGEAGEVVHRVDVAGDVGGAGDGKQTDSPVVPDERALERRGVDPALRGHGDVDDVRDAAPGQLVRMVLHDGRDDDVVGPEREPAGQVVDRFRRVLREEDDVLPRIRADEAGHPVARLLEDPRGKERLVSRPPVDVGVPAQELLDRRQHGPERRRARGVVEVDVGAQAPFQDGNSLVHADDLAAQGEQR